MHRCLRHATVGALVLAALTSCQKHAGLDERRTDTGGSGPRGVAGAGGAEDTGGASSRAERPTGATAGAEPNGTESGESASTGGVGTGGGPDDGTPASAGSTPGGGAPTGAEGGNSAAGGTSVPLPCEILKDAGHQCVAAHSTVRTLVAGYTGRLYQILRSDGLTQDIGAKGAYADVSLQDSLCCGYSCSISIVYDQSGQGNDLSPAAADDAAPAADELASSLIVMIDGHAAYGIAVKPGVNYRNTLATGTAKGDEPETVYMVTSQQGLVDGCCFEYGNTEAISNDDGNGAAEAVYFGTNVVGGTGVDGGPWVMADLGNGLYAGWEDGQDAAISSNTPLAYDFVTAVLVGDAASENGGQGRFALFGGDATTGTLKTMYDGIRPAKAGYVPMKKTGAIGLGSAVGTSADGGGRFYEGVIANGAASKATLDALQAAIVAARYGT